MGGAISDRTDLCGLWKDQHEGLLVQLHGAEARVHKPDADLAGMVTMKAVARVQEGDEFKMTEHVRLTSVLPKRDVVITVVDSGRRGPTMWDITGVVVQEVRR